MLIDKRLTCFLPVAWLLLQPHYPAHQGKPMLSQPPCDPKKLLTSVSWPLQSPTTSPTNAPVSSGGAYGVRYGGTAEDLAQSVATDASGNAYIAGWTSSPTCSFGGQTLTGTSGDVIVAAYDNSATLTWARRFVRPGALAIAN